MRSFPVRWTNVAGEVKTFDGRNITFLPRNHPGYGGNSAAVLFDDVNGGAMKIESGLVTVTNGDAVQAFDLSALNALTAPAAAPHPAPADPDDE